MSATRPRKSVVLYVCKQCGGWNTLPIMNRTINRCVSLGAREVKVHANRQRPCSICGAFGRRLMSGTSSQIVAVVDRSKRKEVRNLEAIAEELNTRQEEGESCDIHDANTAYFQVNRFAKQGKGGRKYWGMPFRRWKDALNDGLPEEEI